MAEVTIVLKDTPEGGVYIHTEYKPGVGNPCTRAQQAALEIINRTAREFGLPSVPPVKLRPALPANVSKIDQTINYYQSTGHRDAVPGDRRFFLTEAQAAIAADTRPHLTGGTDL